MQQLYILRHAKAVTWTPGTEDFPRALSPAGADHALRLAEWLPAHLHLPQCILCSPSQRTRETLAPLLRHVPELETLTHFIPQMYLAEVATLETLLDAAYAEHQHVMLVGHNPGLEVLTGRLIHPRHDDAFQRLPTGTLAVIEFDGNWPEVARQGRLLHLVRGKKLSPR